MLPVSSTWYSVLAIWYNTKSMGSFWLLHGKSKSTISAFHHFSSPDWSSASRCCTLDPTKFLGLRLTSLMRFDLKSWFKPWVYNLSWQECSKWGILMTLSFQWQLLCFILPLLHHRPSSRNDLLLYQLDHLWK